MPEKKRSFFSNVPIYVNILTIFLAILIVFGGLLIGFNYYEYRKASLQVANEFLEEVSGKVFEHFGLIYDPIFAMVELTAELPETKQQPTIAGHVLTKYFMKFIRLYPFITSCYIGLENGDFYQIVHLGENSEANKVALGAPPESRWAIQTILRRRDGQRVRLWRFLDQAGATISSRTRNHSSYDPRKRSWYQKAQDTSDVIRSQPYVYASSKEVGITIAKRFDSKIQGVFGADLTNNSISLFLKDQKMSKDTVLLVYNYKEEVLAFSDTDRLVQAVASQKGAQERLVTLEGLKDPTVKSLHEALRKKTDKNLSNITFEHDGKRFLGKIWPIPDKYGDQSYFLIAEPEQSFTQHVSQTSFRSLIGSIVILLITIPMVVLVAFRLSSPIKALTGEALKIKQLHLSEAIHLESRVNEINHLHDAMATMKSGLEAFMKYVPRSLVQHLITSGISPELGGERRELTILFSDIKDFTAISEKQDPEELMVYISEYFQVLGNEILESHGTIDKFIGDAIMAFWNAPQRLSDHAYSACIAALNCQAVSNRLNESLAKKGRPPFYTRIGLHTGDAIVGNIGTSDRMNYTTMGSAVNLASRLENLNKKAGTQILISDSTRKQVEGKFVFRKIGKIVVKGQTEPNEISELRGLVADASPDEIRYAETWEKGYQSYLQRDWEDALKVFAGFKQEYPDDILAEYYHSQALKFSQNPPPEDWDAVIVFTTK